MNQIKPMVEHAQSYAALGWRVFPIKPGAKFPPLVRDWPNVATTDPAMIRAWWRGTPEANIGIALGEQTGAFVIDPDVKNGTDGPAQLKAIADRLGIEIPKSCIAQSPSGGFHVYLAWVAGIRNSESKIAPGVDIKSDRGYVLAPPSRTELGEYRWLRLGWPPEPPAALIEHIQAASTAVSVAAGTPGVDDRDVIPAGEQEAAIHGRAFQIARHQPRPSVREATAQLWQFIQDRCPNAPDREPWTIEHAVAKIERAYAVAIEHPIATDDLDVPTDVELRPLAEVLDEVEHELRRYVLGGDHLYTTVTLWIAHTHTHDAFDTTPYLHVSSSEPQCGKTRLLEVIEMLSADALASTSLTGPSLFRTIELRRPTLILDEIDNLFRGRSADSERASDILEVLNGGFRRSGTVIRLVGKNHEPKMFSTYCPKVLAGIGGIPATLADRSIPLRMRRKLPSEHVERMRFRDAKPVLTRIRDELGLSIGEYLEQLADSRPAMPDALSDRQADAWEPLFAIADLVGGRWPISARAAAIGLHAEGPVLLDSGNTLLADCLAIFNEEGLGRDRMSVKDMTTKLNAMTEEVWQTLNGGRGLEPAELRRRLAAYEIRAHRTKAGYRLMRSAFTDAYTRYGSSGERDEREAEDQ